MGGRRTTAKRRLATFKKKSIETAEQFDYGPDIVRRIENAKTEIEISRILTTARNKDDNYGS